MSPFRDMGPPRLLLPLMTGKPFRGTGSFSVRKTKTSFYFQKKSAINITRCIGRTPQLRSPNPKCGWLYLPTLFAGESTSFFWAAPKYGTLDVWVPAHRQSGQVKVGWKFTTATAVEKKMPELAPIPPAACCWILVTLDRFCAPQDSSLCQKPITSEMALYPMWYFRPESLTEGKLSSSITERLIPVARSWNFRCRKLSGYCLEADATFLRHSFHSIQ